MFSNKLDEGNFFLRGMKDNPGRQCRKTNLLFLFLFFVNIILSLS